jgi:hypothetical protein
MKKCQMNQQGMKGMLFVHLTNDLLMQGGM